MMSFLQRYFRWLHTQWPAGVVEKLPRVRADGSSNVSGLFIVGDLTGIPLLKFSSDSGARAVQTILSEKGFVESRKDDSLDLVIIGAGVSGMAAALEAKKNNLSYELLEATEPFSTVVNFPRRKPIFTYPTAMIPAGDLQFNATVKEPLLEELRSQTFGRGITPRMARVERVERNGNEFIVTIPGEQQLRTRRVIVAIGRSGDFRKLNVPGEDRDKVSNRLHDPKDFNRQNVLVVGGGDSAIEAAIALAQCGTLVTLSYRKASFSRPKPANIERLNTLIADPMADVAIETPVSERVTTSSGIFLGQHRKPGRIQLMLESEVVAIGETDVTLRVSDGSETMLPNSAVFTMIGREAPLEFFRRSGVAITGEMGWKQWSSFALFLLLCTFVYVWKAGGSLSRLFSDRGWFPYNVDDWMSGISDVAAAMVGDPSTLLGTLAVTIQEPGFYYSLAYTLLVTIFGIQRIRRRRTAYVTAQTLSLTIIQIVPLFLLPYFALPLMGYHGWFDGGLGKEIADALFPAVNYGHGREYWRAFGFILAWPLFIWNVFTAQPLWWWLGISLLQTFVLIPLIIYFWGKGAYCGWICSCGAMAETLGDTHRQKMPHGAGWNRVNIVGQVILGIALLLVLLRVVSWILPGTETGRFLAAIFNGMLKDWSLLGVELNYKYVVDLFLAGIVGYGAYFWFSGRVWCRFACPLAALMHIYARFSRFRILAEKKKCISCNVCTSVCHQGIDVMNFANKGLPMEDPECVRCSACVQSCPTGVLSFGQIDRTSGMAITRDSISASPVRMREHESA